MMHTTVGQNVFRLGGALLVAAGLLITTHAVPTFADRPSGADCAFVTQGFWDCTTSDGHEWYCTNQTDVSACQQVKFMADPGLGLAQPVHGGVFIPISTGAALGSRLPAGTLHVAP